MRCCRYVVDSMLFAGKILHSLGLGLRGRVSRRADVGGGVEEGNLVVSPAATLRPAAAGYASSTRLVDGPAEAVPFRLGAGARWALGCFAPASMIFGAYCYYRLPRGGTMPTLFGLECLV